MQPVSADNRQKAHVIISKQTATEKYTIICKNKGKVTDVACLRTEKKYQVQPTKHSRKKGTRIILTQCNNNFTFGFLL